jgi:hypothetical protein
MRSPTIFTDSETLLESDTEVESDDAQSDNDLENHLVLGFSAHTIDTLEDCLLSALKNDLDLAANLIPHIYGILQVRNTQTTSDFSSLGPNDAKETPDASEPPNTSTAQASIPPPSGDNAQRSRIRKRGRDEDEDDTKDGRGKRRSGRTDPRSSEWIDESIPPMFACHFRKKDPRKYNRPTNRKYHNCVCPSIPHKRLSRIK